MMLKRWALGALFTAVLALPGAALAARAATPAELEGVVAIAHVGTVAGLCGTMGFTGTDALQDDMIKIARRAGAAAGLARREIATTIDATIDRDRETYFRADSTGRFRVLKPPPGGTPEAVAFYRAIADECVRLDSDPVYGPYIAAPAGFDPPAAGVDLAGRVLTDNPAALSSTVTQAQFDRANEVARNAMLGATCTRLGFTFDPGPQSKLLVAGYRYEAAASGLSPAASDPLMVAAIDRQSKAIADDAGATMTTAEGMRAFYLRLGRDCLKASRDTLVSRVLKAPAGFDPQRAANDLADVSLAKGGFASWQTPAIRARGDLMGVTGSCRKLIGAQRADDLFKTYARSDDARERAYYVESFDNGVAGKFNLDLDLTQCERAIAGYIAKAAPPPP